MIFEPYFETFRIEYLNTKIISVNLNFVKITFDLFPFSFFPCSGAIVGSSGHYWPLQWQQALQPRTIHSGVSLLLRLFRNVRSHDHIRADCSLSLPSGVWGWISQQCQCNTQ